MRTGHLTVAACIWFFVLHPGLHAAERDLRIAILSNHIERVESILDQTHDRAASQTWSAGITPLHLAAAANHAEIVKLLLDRGAPVNAQTETGFTPLHWVAGRDADAAAAELIKADADIQAKAQGGITPLDWAAWRNATNVLKRLIQAGANIDQQTQSGQQALHWAIKGGAHDSATLLARKAVQKLGIPPIFATSTGIVQTVKHASVPRRPPALYHEHPTAAGKQLSVDIGFDQVLDFIWIPSVDLWVGKTEISNAQFRRFRSQHNSLFRDTYSLNDPRQPVVRVNWNDAVSFCAWLTHNYSEYLPDRMVFRLPTATEWNAFASCGETRLYPWGNQWPPPYGNFSDLSAKEQFSNWQGLTNYTDGCVVSCPVEESGVSDWGLYGVAGNVWEWCQDWYDASQTLKVRHGGSWDFDTATNLRLDTKGFDRPEARYPTIGFRVVIGN